MIIPADTLTQGHLRAHGYRIRALRLDLYQNEVLHRVAAVVDLV